MQAWRDPVSTVAHEVQAPQPGGGEKRPDQKSDETTADEPGSHDDRDADRDQRQRGDGYREAVHVYAGRTEVETTITLQGVYASTRSSRCALHLGTRALFSPRGRR